jgi:polar amino acid transport system permease protein
MKLSVIVNAFPYLLGAAWTTIYVSVLGMLVGQAIGAMVCICRVSGNRAAELLGGLYVSYFRGVPLLVQLLLIYYLLPVVNINVPALAAAVAALGLASGAYVSEIYRGSLNAVPPGQVEAALTLGFPASAIWRRILLPQALRLSLPALINELILLLKASSLISVVGVAELTRVSQTMAASTYRPLEMYLAAGLIYLAINGVLALLGATAERRFGWG